MMHSHRKKKGFTLAETLVTVAIIGILGAVAFVSVLQYMRSMAQLERDGIAKEIFISAQNHLTMAESQGYLGRTAYGTQESGSGEENGVYYFVVNGSWSFPGNTVLDLMLPFASVDETVRLGGSYIVRYQAKPALVLDVFYCTPSGTRFGHTLSEGDYSTVMSLRDDKNARRNWDGAVLGWYGGEEAQTIPRGEKILVPELEIINADRLVVKVTDTNSKNNDASLTLIVTGEVSGSQKAFTLEFGSVSPNVSHDNGLTRIYTVVLDDVTTAGMHFSELLEEFIPGENITVQAVAFSNKVLTNIAYSSQKKTNSLYEEIRADGQGAGEGGGSFGSEGGGSPAGGQGSGEAPGTVVSGSGLTACVNSIRHLENLSASVSGVNAGGAGVQIAKALQTTDLDWTGFRESIATETGGSAEAVSIFRTGERSGTENGCFLPVSTVQDQDGGAPTWALDYDGQGHSISKIKVRHSGDAGLFGALAAESRVSGLLLLDFDITSTGGNAGALAGSLDQTEVTNVLARGAEASAAVTGGSGSSGGLAGTAEGGSFTACAASLFVRSSGGNAGGLVGSASGGVSAAGCYSGGHTSEGKYSTDGARINVVSDNGAAGGLFGTAGDAGLSACYSTCSVSGKSAAGGLIGTASGASVQTCYATGLVATPGWNGPGGETAVRGSANPSSAGAFAGSFSGTAQNCGYLEIINETPGEDQYTIAYLAPLGGNQTNAGIVPFDADTASYMAFTGAPGDWQDAGPYDNTLIRDYQGKYNLKTVTQLDAGREDLKDSFAVIHYGDWPSPEIMIENKK